MLFSREREKKKVHILIGIEVGTLLKIQVLTGFAWWPEDSPPTILRLTLSEARSTSCYSADQLIFPRKLSHYRPGTLIIILI